MDAASPAPAPPGLSTLGATAMYVSALLGAGVLTLTTLAARIAGPASLLAWAALLLLSIPISQTFAALAARYPGGAGTAGFVRAAFGDRAGIVVGMLFWLNFPIGAPAAAMIGSTYLAQAVGGGRLTVLLGAAVIIGVPAILNATGIHVASRIQAVALAALALLVVVVSVGNIPNADPGHLTPFAPAGYLAVAPAIGLLFFSFAGWEASTHISGELRDPSRDTRRIAWLTLGILSALYLGLAVTTVLVLGPDGGPSDAPMTALLALIAPGAAVAITTALAVVLVFGTANTYLAGVARLGATFADAGVLPAVLREEGTPRRNLLAMALLTGAALVVIGVFDVPLGVLIGITSANLAVVTTAGMAAGARLLAGRARVGALVATVLTGLVCLFCGIHLLGPLLMMALTLVLITVRRVSPRRA